MKRIPLVLMLFIGLTSSAQENLEDLLAAGIDDAKRFTQGYITPAAEAMIYATSNNWIQEAKVKKPLKFDVSIMLNATFTKEKHQSFTLNTNDYNNLQFRDGSIVKDVATAFGENDPTIIVFAEVTDESGVFTDEVEFELPQGLASVNVNAVPTAFLQARLGLVKGLEVKARYFPKIEQEDVKVGLIGGGLQYEFTSLLPAEKVFPVAIAGFIGYTNLTANYDFTDDEIIDGDNQQFDVKQNSFVFQAQASTKFKVLNFYGGIGYVNGTSEFSVLGRYRVRGGIPLFETESEFTNPFSFKTKVSGVRATVGAKLQLGFFGFHADYNLAEFNTVSAGLHFGI